MPHSLNTVQRWRDREREGGNAQKKNVKNKKCFQHFEWAAAQIKHTLKVIIIFVLFQAFSLA